MTLEAIARAYVRCVELDDLARSRSSDLGESVADLRGELHAVLMQALRDAHIPFADRSEAAQIAFEIVQGKRKIA